MRKIILLLTITTYASGYVIEHYKNKIFYVKPKNVLTTEKNDNSIIFKTNISTNKCILLNDGKIIVKQNDTVSLLSPDLAVVKKIKLGYEFKILIPDQSGKFIITGKPERRKKTYKIFKTNLLSGETKPVIELDKFHFPGIAPIKRAEDLIKKDPSFVDIYFNSVYDYEDFSDGFIRNDTLYIWFKPEYGLHKGRLYSISLDKKTITTSLESINTILGYTRKTIAFTKTYDEDATSVDKAIYTLTSPKRIKRYPFYFISSNNVKYANGKVFAIHNDSLFIVELNKNTFSSIQIPGEKVTLQSVSPSGMRVFLTYVKDSHIILAVYDLYLHRLKTLYQNLKYDISSLHTTYDGEGFVFVGDNLLHVGYIDDLRKPYVVIEGSDTTENERIKLTIHASDVSFISGLKTLKFNGEVIKNNFTTELILKDTLNVFKAEAIDRAGNKKVIKKTIFYKSR